MKYQINLRFIKKKNKLYKMKKLIGIGAVLAIMLSSCANEELEGRVDALEKKVESLSANELINNPATANTPTGEVVNDGPTASIKFAEEEFDFGTVNQNDIVEHTYNFTNTGDVPLIIENATASCGCTVPDWPKEPIAPGASSQINVKFDSKGKQGQQNKQITIRANTNPNFTKVTLKGNVLTPEGGPAAVTTGADNHEGHNH